MCDIHTKSRDSLVGVSRACKVRSFQGLFFILIREIFKSDNGGLYGTVKAKDSFRGLGVR